MPRKKDSKPAKGKYDAKGKRPAADATTAVKSVSKAIKPAAGGALEDDLMADLEDIEGVELLSEASVMHFRRKCRTPLTMVNYALSGGFPFGSVVEAWGPTTAGKSTFCYQTVGLFQIDYPDGVAVILDTEISTDHIRMEMQGVNLQRVARVPAGTLEAGFTALFKLVEKFAERATRTGRKTPVLVLWDTIAAALTDAQYESNNYNANGIGEKARVLKQNLSKLFVELEKVDMVVILLNQASTQFNQYQASLGSSGGNALKHDAHVKLKFGGGKTEMMDDDMMAKGKTSWVDIEKSKISPVFKGFPIWIDSLNGGIIDDSESLFEAALKMGLIKDRKSGWYYMITELAGRTEAEMTCVRKDVMKARLADNDGGAMDLLKNSLISYFYQTSTYMRHVYEATGYCKEAWELLKDVPLAPPAQPPDEDDGEFAHIAHMNKQVVG